MPRTERGALTRNTELREVGPGAAAGPRESRRAVPAASWTGRATGGRCHLGVSVPLLTYSVYHKVTFPRLRPALSKEGPQATGATSPRFERSAASRGEWLSCWTAQCRTFPSSLDRPLHRTPFKTRALYSLASRPASPLTPHSLLPRVAPSPLYPGPSVGAPLVFHISVIPSWAAPYCGSSCPRTSLNAI